MTPDEIAARDDEPRPGVWLQQEREDYDGTGAPLDQVQTDHLIAYELLCRLRGDEFDEVADLGRALVPLRVPSPLGPALASQQRGGIHSEPAIRVLAFQTWGDRDRRWGEIKSGTELFVDDHGGVVTYRRTPQDQAVGTATEPQGNVVVHLRLADGHWHEARLGTGMPSAGEILRRRLGPDHRCRCVEGQRCEWTGQRVNATTRCTQQMLREFGVLPARDE